MDSAAVYLQVTAQCLMFVTDGSYWWGTEGSKFSTDSLKCLFQNLPFPPLSLVLCVLYIFISNASKWNHRGEIFSLYTCETGLCVLLLNDR